MKNASRACRALFYPAASSRQGRRNGRPQLTMQKVYQSGLYGL